MFVVLSGSAIICCYLNYQFAENLSIKVFYMFGAAFVVDMLIFRLLLLLIMTLIKFCCACGKGYKKIEY